MTNAVTTLAQSNAYGSWATPSNDGCPDLLVVQHYTPNELYRTDGLGQFTDDTTGSGLPGTGRVSFGAAWGDFNGDGFPDVCAASGIIHTPQHIALYRNNGNANNWIKVRCVGTDSNRSAIGAKVRVKARIDGVDRWQLREIGGDRDGLSCHSLDTLVGLGDATIIDTIRVEWPLGRVQEFHNVPAKQTLVIVERTESSVTPDAADGFDLNLFGPRQQRYRVDSAPDLSAWSPAGEHHDHQRGRDRDVQLHA